MAKAGEIVVVDFPGIQGIKRRPAVILSSDAYHQTRPDIIVGLVTSQLSSATGTTDCVLQDWRVSGLHSPSAFRSFLVTPAHLGRASDRDWQSIVTCIQTALAGQNRSPGP